MRAEVRESHYISEGRRQRVFLLRVPGHRAESFSYGAGRTREEAIELARKRRSALVSDREVVARFVPKVHVYWSHLRGGFWLVHCSVHGTATRRIFKRSTWGKAEGKRQAEIVAARWRMILRAKGDLLAFVRNERKRRMEQSSAGS